MKNMRIHIWLPLLLALLGSPVARGQEILNDSVGFGGNFAKAAFRIWYDPQIRFIRGVVVMVPGSNGDGRDRVLDTAWQDLARRHGFALVGCQFTDRNHPYPDIDGYADVKGGSGQALLDALERFAAGSGHPELAEAPLALWGISAGGEVNYELACWKPERILAFVVNKGGIYYTALAPDATREIPAVFFTGMDDLVFRSDIVKGIFAANRRFGARWMLVEEPHTAHEFKASERFARLFLDRIIPMRLPETGSDEPGKLQPVPSGKTLGVAGSLQILPATDKTQFTALTSWLPSDELAEAWLKINSGTNPSR